MTLNENFINCNVLDLVILYNFGIKFDFIRDHMKKLWFFLRGTICRGRPCHHRALKNGFVEMGEAWPAPTNATIFRGGLWRRPPLEMFFLGAGDAMNRLWKWRSFLGAVRGWPASKNTFLRGGSDATVIPLYL